MKKTVLSLTLALAASLSMCLSAAAATYIPDDVTYENLNGHQLAIKTYTLLPDQDPDDLIEEDFEYAGYRYSYSSVVKEEQEYNEEKEHTETVTITTASKDLADILEELEPTITYDDGSAAGTLSLDHSTIRTEAAGYKNSSYPVTATKNYSGLERNDSSYIDKTVVKDGRTLTLSNVTWSVESTAQVGDELVPATYAAVATYSGSASSRVATGYITTADYTGTISASGISAIRYTVSYLGTPVESGVFHGIDPLLFPGIGLFALLLLLFVLLKRSNTTVYASTGNGNEYKKCGRVHLRRKDPVIRLEKLKEVPRGMIAVEVEERIARRLFGRNITVRRYGSDFAHTVGAVHGPYWFTMDLNADDELETETEVDA